MRSKALRAERATLITHARALINKDSATADDGRQADEMLARADALMVDIERIERADKMAADLAVQNAARAAAKGVSTDEHESALARDKRILRAHMIGPGAVAQLTEADRQYHQERLQISNAGDTTSGGGSAGGYTVAPDYSYELLIAMKAFGNVRGVAKTIATDTGASLPYPTMDDTANVATIVAGQNVQIAADTDLAFGSISLGAYTYKSGLMPVSLQLLQDSAFDFDSLIRNAMAMRFARGQNAHFTTGSGAGQPTGVLTAAQLGVQAAVGNTTSISFDNLMDLYHSVDPAYRTPDARWMMNDLTLKAIKKLKDVQARPLFVPGYVEGTPDMLLGVPISINQQMPVQAASAKTVLYGDFTNYVIRDVLGVQMLVLRERFADFLQVAYLAFMRTDANLMSAAAPIKYFQQSAT